MKNSLWHKKKEAFERSIWKMLIIKENKLGYFESTVKI
jgi:hypothetical protein